MKILLAASLLALSPVAAHVATKEAAPATPPAEHSIDAGHSSVLFKTRHLGISNFYGRFNTVRGTIGYDPENPDASSVTIEIDAASVDSNSEGRDQHLRSADFFSAKEFPVIRFESTAVRATDDGLAVTGDLSFHGVTKSIEIPVTKVGEGEAMNAYRMGFDTSFEIDMRDYGVTFVEKNPGAIGPMVELLVSLETTRN